VKRDDAPAYGSAPMTNEPCPPTKREIARAAVSFRGTASLSPDVQQQVVAQVFLLWLLVAAIVVWTARDPSRRVGGSATST
jgi:hypothetical protein